MRTLPGSHAGVGAEAKNRVATKSEEAWAGREVVKILIFTVKNLETEKKCITFVAQKIWRLLQPLGEGTLPGVFRLMPLLFA